MTIKNKLKLIVEGVIIPFVIFNVVTLIITIFAIILTLNLKLNLVVVQGVANIFNLIILLPLYTGLLKKYDLIESKFDIKNFITIIPLAFALCIAGNIISNFIPTNTENKVTAEVIKMIEKYNIYIAILFVAVIIPIIEEIIFRGFFFETVKLISNDVVAILITSIVFAIAHWDLRQGIYAFIAGLFLGYVKCKYRKLLYTIWMHLLMNFMSVVFVEKMININDVKKIFFILFMSVLILLFSTYSINKISKK